MNKLGDCPIRQDDEALKEALRRLSPTVPADKTIDQQGREIHFGNTLEDFGRKKLPGVSLHIGQKETVPFLDDGADLLC